jgi:hypothetical protein
MSHLQPASISAPMSTPTSPRADQLRERLKLSIAAAASAATNNTNDNNDTVQDVQDKRVQQAAVTGIARGVDIPVDEEVFVKTETLDKVDDCGNKQSPPVDPVLFWSGNCHHNHDDTLDNSTTSNSKKPKTAAQLYPIHGRPVSSPRRNYYSNTFTNNNQAAATKITNGSIPNIYTSASNASLVGAPRNNQQQQHAQDTMTTTIVVPNTISPSASNISIVGDHGGMFQTSAKDLATTTTKRDVDDTTNDCLMHGYNQKSNNAQQEHVDANKDASSKKDVDIPSSSSFVRPLEAQQHTHHEQQQQQQQEYIATQNSTTAASADPSLLQLSSSSSTNELHQQQTVGLNAKESVSYLSPNASTCMTPNASNLSAQESNVSTDSNRSESQRYTTNLQQQQQAMLYTRAQIDYELEQLQAPMHQPQQQQQQQHRNTLNKYNLFQSRAQPNAPTHTTSMEQTKECT